jgi:hypothetical protein
LTYLSFLITYSNPFLGAQKLDFNTHIELEESDLRKNAHWPFKKLTVIGSAW